MSIRVRVPRERAASKCCSGCFSNFSVAGVWSMETHQSMEQERGSVLPSKPQLLQQHVLEEERVHRPHLCNDRLEDIVQVSTLFSPSLSLSHTHTHSLSLCVSLKQCAWFFPNLHVWKEGWWVASTRLSTQNAPSAVRLNSVPLTLKPKLGGTLLLYCL